MPIPQFDHNHVLPPHTGDPTNPRYLSPYSSSILEFCQRFATSSFRIDLLHHLIRFRQKMTLSGITKGFQWIDGSFTENIEVSQKRNPKDLDLITFYRDLTAIEEKHIEENFPEFTDQKMSANMFKLDHYLVDYNFDPEYTITATRYWIQLFTHTRLDVWKGIIQLPLNTPEDDQLAIDYLITISHASDK